MPEPGFVKVARVDEVPEGGVHYVEANGAPIVLCKVEGKVFAVGNLCTHDDGPLGGGTLDDHQIECPRHGARFDIRDGSVVCLPAAVPIPSYPVQVIDGAIWVKVR